MNKRLLSFLLVIAGLFVGAVVVKTVKSGCGSCSSCTLKATCKKCDVSKKDCKCGKTCACPSGQCKCGKEKLACGCPKGQCTCGEEGDK